MSVTDSRMLCSLPRSCLVHPIDRFDSEGWFSYDQVIFLTLFRVFLVKKHAAFKWKDTISGFPVSPGSARALVRWGGKIKYILIAYFLSNICAKNCRNRTVYVKIIASCKSGTFFLRHGVGQRQRSIMLTGLVTPVLFSTQCACACVTVCMSLPHRWWANTVSNNIAV